MSRASISTGGLLLLGSILLLSGCFHRPDGQGTLVPHEERWGIYALDLAANTVELIYSASRKVSSLRLDSSGDRFAFSQKVGGGDNSHEEICTLRVDGTDFARLTNNTFWDLYPAWSPDGAQIAFLSNRDGNLDIFVMDAAGGNVRKLYDSGGHDADIDWRNGRIAFTRDSRIWLVNDDGANAEQVTDPPLAGQWGNANLPFGDYDPRIHPDGSKIVFERLIDDTSSHGIYEIIVIDPTSKVETALTGNTYTQGLAAWSHGGDRLVYLVTAIGPVGKYDIWMMNADGTDNRDITPSYFPGHFLCHSPIFSTDGSKVFFVGEWWSAAESD